MHIYGKAAISDLLGDLVVYRSLRPADSRLPGLAEIQAGPPPRKGEPAYADVVAEILRAARRITLPNTRIRRLIMIGDTRRSDAGAFETLCAATGWRGRAFICDEVAGAAPQTHQEGSATYANSWQALFSFQAMLEAEEFPIDAETVVAIDIDKTLLGAKGRNHRLIDRARLQALQSAVAHILGHGFDQALFETTYRELDQARYHPLTEDNQDNVAYLCVMVGGGILASNEPAKLLKEGHTFRDTIDIAGDRIMGSAPVLAPFHDEIARLVLAGDPTPFKDFRRREYIETVAYMGIGTGSAEELLNQSIVITGEIWEIGQAWRKQAALLFGLSDKPDEAADGVAAGGRPIHRIPTHIIGV